MARSIPIAMAILIIAAAPVIAQNETQYYAGKRITILVNFAPGGPVTSKVGYWRAMLANTFPAILQSSCKTWMGPAAR